MTQPPDPAGGGPVELLPLALSRPQEALARARVVLAGRPGPLEAAVAHQCVGIVLREFGDIDAAIAEMRMARRLARRAGAPDREADVLATLGITLGFAGRPTAARRALDTAAARTSGHLHGRVRHRRAVLHQVLGQHQAALDDLDVAVDLLRAASDGVWEARALTARAFARLASGAVRPARADLDRAQRLFTETGQELESADAVAHQGLLALRVGDLPSALAHFDASAARFAQLGLPDYDHTVDRCAALLAAGLPGDALREAEKALADLRRAGVKPSATAELVLTAAGCALAAGDTATALSRAREAGRLFERQGRAWWSAHARLTRVRAALAAGPVTPALLRTARTCVAELEAVRSPDVQLGRLTAGRVALALGRRAEADTHLAAAAASVRRGPALARAQAWLAEALRAEAVGDTRRLLHACRRGLQVIDQHRSLLGSLELRAQVTAHGAELARIGQRSAAARDRPRDLLVWSERWRAVAHAVPAVRPPDDDELQADLAAMRAVTHRLAEGPTVRGPAVHQLERERQRLERAVRARELRSRGAGAAARPPGDVDVQALLAALGDDVLVELVDIEGRLEVLICGSGTVRRAEAGRLDRAVREVLFARFSLTRMGARTTSVSAEEAFVQLLGLGEALQEVLLGGAADRLGAGRVVVVPPGRLHAVPWALLPALRGRAFTVAPSAVSWLRAHRAAGRDAAAESDAPVVLVRGPGLASEGLEVPQLAASYGRSVVLGGGSATVADVLAAMDGAALVHVAAHGTFRADSPLFSSLLLDDGPLTLYDLARLRRGPRRLVLSSCDSGVVAPVGADEILGLASSLLPLGTTGIVASVVPVDDHAVVPLMVELHRRLRSGAGLAEALRAVRAGSAGDPLPAATAMSFLALGADAGGSAA